jgi:hypothetical protein
MFALAIAIGVYAGAMFSKVSNGLSSGFLHTSTIDPTVGLRFTFRSRICAMSERIDTAQTAKAGLRHRRSEDIRPPLSRE